MTHDAKAFVALLKDHLAAHDRPVSFLFGAGTSSCIATATGPLIPAIGGMTSCCASAVASTGANGPTAWSKLIDECTKLGIPPNIESVLGRVRSKLDAVVGDDVVGGLTRGEWEAFDNVVRTEIARLVTPPTFPPHLPHHHFANWVKNTSRRQPVEIFTTNYDVLFETAFDELRVPHFDGFIGSQHAYFCAEAIEDETVLPPSSWARYWKLHGSVAWSFEKVGTDSRITRRAPKSTGEMILPSHRKYDESRKEPYRSLMDRLSRVLAREGSILFAAGYSFSDQHINSIIFDALEQFPRSHLIALMYGALNDSPALMKRAEVLPNIVVAGRNEAVVARRRGQWSVSGKSDPALSAATLGLVHPDPHDADQPCVHAGDFNAFCSFLHKMQGGI